VYSVIVSALKFI